ncbi:MAG: enoyl-CoA hydratase/isomerase family protein [Rhodanobacteraceae bacterium]
MIEIIEHADIREIRLARPPVNALNPTLVRQLRETIEIARGDGIRGLLLSGASGMFSAGLDVPFLLGLDRAEMERFWREFFGLCADLACSPVPVAAALTGHCPAGGTVLAILCDFRVMARGEFRIGLNEVQVGLSVPDCIQAAMRRLVGVRRAEQLMVAGALIEAERAHASGLVDELADVDQVVPRALGWLSAVLKLPPNAMSETRRSARADLVAVFADPDKLPVEEFLDGWFAVEAQATLSALVTRLRDRKPPAP